MDSERAEPPLGIARATPRWRAPTAQGQALIDPPLDAAIAWLQAATLHPSGSPALDLDAAATARLAHAELLAAARRHTARYADVDATAWGATTRIASTGHQPALFHPGVWLKNAALGWLSRAGGAAAVNVIVDNDTLKAPSIRVPGGAPDSVTVEAESYDAAGDEVPYEERAIVDRATFDTFGARVARRVAPLVAKAIIDSYWPLVREAADAGLNLGEALAAGRHRWELAHGNRTLEAPLSALCRGRAFRRLVSAWLLEAGRGRDAYNNAILDYRARYRVRSRNHPAPLLDEWEGWLEAPLWCWSREQPRRQRLFVRRQGERLHIGDPRGVHVECSATAESLVARLDEAEQAGWKVRPRALFTTLFLRMLTADVFLHGIGGALYDRVTDRLMASLFGVSPRPYVVATATLLLPGAECGARVDDVRRLDAALRDASYHPERCLAPPWPADVERWIAEKQAWIATPQTRENARRRAQAFARINQELQPAVAAPRARLEAAREQAVESLRGVGPLRSREYAFCLFPEKTWGQLLAMLPAMP